MAKLLITALIVVGALLWYLFSENSSPDTVRVLAIIIVCAYWGHSVTKDADSNVLYDVKTYGFISIFKFILSVVFGIFLAPIGIYKCIKEIMNVRKLRDDMANGRA